MATPDSAGRANVGGFGGVGVGVFLDIPRIPFADRSDMAGDVGRGFDMSSIRGVCTSLGVEDLKADLRATFGFCLGVDVPTGIQFAANALRAESEGDSGLFDAPVCGIERGLADGIDSGPDSVVEREAERNRLSHAEEEEAELAGLAGLLVIRSMVSLKDGRSCASKRGMSPRLLLRLGRGLGVDMHLELSMTLDSAGQASHSNDSEQMGCEGYEIGRSEFRRYDDEPVSRGLVVMNWRVDGSLSDPSPLCGTFKLDW